MTGQVWIDGRRIGEYHLVDLATGTPAKTIRLDRLEKSAGLGWRCARDFVAVYVQPGGEIVLQVGAARFPLDGSTKVTYRTLLGGFVARLRIEREGMPTTRVRQYVIGGTLQGWLDPGYDGLDRSFDDLLGEVADIAGSDKRRQAFRDAKDSLADPSNQPGDRA